MHRMKTTRSRALLSRLAAYVATTLSLTQPVLATDPGAPRAVPSSPPANPVETERRTTEVRALPPVYPTSAAPQTASKATAVELLVKCDGGPGGAAARAADAAVGATPVHLFEAIGWHVVRLPEGVSTAEGLARYRAQPGVLGVEPNGALRRPLPPAPAPEPELGAYEPPTGRAELHSTPPAAVKPNDPRYPSQWSLKKIGMEQAWAITTGSTNVVVAVMDTGVNYLHPDLAPNMWRNPGETGLDAQGRDKATNGIDDDGNGYIDDVHGIDVQNHTGDPMDLGYTAPGLPNPRPHGTSCAGVIGAVGNNNTGVAGINWQIRIMAIKVLGGDEQLGYSTDKAGYVECMEYLVQMKRRGVNVRVLSNSTYDDTVSDAVMDAVRAVGGEGIFAAFCAGNDGVDLDTIQWNSNTDHLFHVVTVGGSDRSDGLLYNYGRSTVDLIAPGQDIGTPGFGEGYVFDFGGTSAATPQVAAAAALLCAAKPDISIAELRTALLGSADPVSAARGKIVTGGRLNVARALQSLTEPARAPIVVWSSPAGLRPSSTAPIEVVFSQPMDQASVEEAFVLDPPVAGTFEWSPDNRRFAFQHREPFSLTNHAARLRATARDSEGRMLDGNFDRQAQGAPSDDYLWTFRFPLPNDAFAGAVNIGGTDGSISAHNRTATLEAGEVGPKGYLVHDYDASVWYRWVAPVHGWFTFDLTTGTSIDSLLTIFSGTSVESLSEVASSIHYGSRPTSRASFLASTNNPYPIAVAGVWAENLVGTMGNFTLRWYPTPPPGITSFNPGKAAPGQTVTLDGTNFTGVTRVTLNGVPAAFTATTNANFLDLRLLVTVPPGASSGLLAIETPHGDATAVSPLEVFALPMLRVEAGTGDRVILSWPEEVSSYTLQASEKLGPEARWERFNRYNLEPGTPGVFRVSIARQATAQFYRLVLP